MNTNSNVFNPHPVSAVSFRAVIIDISTDKICYSKTISEPDDVVGCMMTKLIDLVTNSENSYSVNAKASDIGIKTTSYEPNKYRRVEVSIKGKPVLAGSTYPITLISDGIRTAPPFDYNKVYYRGYTAILDNNNTISIIDERNMCCEPIVYTIEKNRTPNFGSNIPNLDRYHDMDNIYGLPTSRANYINGMMGMYGLPIGSYNMEDKWYESALKRIDSMCLRK